MSAASKELGIAQPALSKQMQLLEHELKVKLFNRHSRGVTLTKPGEKLREEASELLRRLEAIKLALKQGEEALTGTVRLAVISSLAPTLAVELYPRIERDYPNIDLHIDDHLSHEAGNVLLREEADLAIVPNAPTDLPQALSIPLFEENFFFIKRATTGERSTEIPFEEAVSQPLILPSDSHDLRRRLRDVALGNDVTLNVKYESGSINVIKGIVEQGLANSIVPITYWLDWISRGQVSAHPIVQPRVSRVHSLCWMPNRTQTPAVEAVRELVQVEVQALIAGGKLSGTIVRA